jgi:CRP/FNR family cyclic AMP-dependent transcriptional regulator
MVDMRLFAGLPEQELRRLVAVARRRLFLRNEIVFHQGDPADTLHLIARGRFAARLHTRLHDTVTVSVQGPGEAFGELALVEPGAVRSASVIALEPGETYAIAQEDFNRLRRQYPTVNDVLVRLLAQQLRRQSELLAEALFVSAETRVLRRLSELVILYGGKQTETIVPLTQADIAGLAGTSRATVNRVLQTEQTRGTVELHRGKTCVLDPAALARRASSAGRSVATDRANP